MLFSSGVCMSSTSTVSVAAISGDQTSQTSAAEKMHSPPPGEHNGVSQVGRHQRWRLFVVRGRCTLKTSVFRRGFFANIFLVAGCSVAAVASRAPTRQKAHLRGSSTQSVV